ncbi:MAG: hypothetical protein A2046_14240 [Bacteroidetes bacterium GWA2_30_7]|nr:MAG: hypothetical protein A2046_14240 [Bacteroidetes bacterium GWA2_30_7]
MKLRVRWLIEVLCFASSSVLAFSLMLRKSPTSYNCKPIELFIITSGAVNDLGVNKFGFFKK